MTKAEAQLEPAVDTILRAGQLVDGKYRVEHLIGEGGMAAVWAGTNERMGKRVALKVILRSLATTCAAQGLFLREALAASLVNHPNVVTVFDIIEHEGMACIVMELLEGEPLSNYLARKGFLSANEAIMLLLPAMRGVAASHSQGVIHRDLKPQNIFICTEPDGRIVTTKVLDFGISIMVEHGIDASAGPPLFLGTPAYMSPEHILGVADIDGRTDVYGFGVLLYEALTGEVAFPGEPGPALLDRVLNEAAPPVALLRADLSPGLVRIIETAMAKERDQRYPDLNSMVRALEDELMPPPPARRSLAPQDGMPSLAARDWLSGPPVPMVEAILNSEPSGQHQETRMLFAIPLERSVPQCQAGRETPEVNLQRASHKARSFGMGSFSVLRAWRGAAFAVVLGFFGMWMALRGAPLVQAGALASIASATRSVREPIRRPPLPAVVSLPTVIDAAALAPSASSPSPSVPNPVATREHGQPARHARSIPVSLTLSHSRVAVRAVVWSSAQRAGASLASTEPRAGRLSEDDF